MNSALRKLRIKFVAIIMVVVAIILAVVFSTIVVISYSNSTTEVYAALDSAISRNAIDVHERPFNKMPDNRAEDTNGEELDEDDSAFDGNVGSADEALLSEGPRFEIGGREPDQSLIPVAVYELHEDGTMTFASNAASGMIADSALAEVADQAFDVPYGHGSIDSLGVFYAKQKRGAETYIAFADERSVSEWQSLAVTLTIIGLATLVLFFVVSLIFSKWALHPVKASWEQQQRFIADASHELKTPLTVMAADTAILKRNSEASIASQSQWVESIEGEIKNMQELVGDMLLLARADGQGEAMPRKTEVIDLSKLVNAELLQFEPVAYERSLDLDSKVAPNVTIDGAKDQLQRLASVLLDNAFKYVNECGRISVQLDKGDGSAVLSVSNSGGFIPAEDLPHVFDRFYRADKARTRTGELSYGLGLSIAREIANIHGGTITATSSEATGTTFTVTLPLQP
ncbi:sensor histidine kinase [Anaerotardibacter muris]|uniref:sensor histidine kinase n=1 Tax=Anaerotardibacter muris TaxID=2941505 RepID=UPI00203BFFDE|nr:HAMP domain-containing sensor histidine kinase [Anaerotardibacter muris]